MVTAKIPVALTFLSTGGSAPAYFYVHEGFVPLCSKRTWSFSSRSCTPVGLRAGTCAAASGVPVVCEALVSALRTRAPWQHKELLSVGGGEVAGARGIAGRD